jgi:hypothetical protein
LELIAFLNNANSPSSSLPINRDDEVQQQIPVYLQNATNEVWVAAKSKHGAWIRNAHLTSSQSDQEQFCMSLDNMARASRASDREKYTEPRFLMPYFPDRAIDVVKLARERGSDEPHIPASNSNDIFMVCKLFHDVSAVGKVQPNLLG